MLARAPIVLLLILAGSPSLSDELHPLMTSKWWASAGSFFAEREFKASAGGRIAGIARDYDFGDSAGLIDEPNLLMAELGWQYAEY